MTIDMPIDKKRTLTGGEACLRGCHLGSVLLAPSVHERLWWDEVDAEFK